MQQLPKILIVEDNADLVAILEQLLAEEYDVRSARSGEAAIEMATSFTPDVVILDVQLPGIDGIQTGLALRESLPAARMLVLTALAGKADPAKILGSGCCDAYLPKPAPLETIRAKVTELLGAGATTSE